MLDPVVGPKERKRDDFPASQPNGVDSADKKVGPFQRHVSRCHIPRGFAVQCDAVGVWNVETGAQAGGGSSRSEPRVGRTPPRAECRRWAAARQESTTMMVE